MQQVIQTMQENLYDRSFFEGQQNGSSLSAKRIVPLVLEVLEVNSVCDVGCGVGTWLETFRENGVKTLCGIDGDYVDTSMLRINRDEFIPADLSEPLAVNGPFDLAVSLEVAEHLPPEISERFVSDLTRLAPAVLFSAAIPKQGGTGHINEKWQEEWAALFSKRNYLAIDFLRPRVWNDTGVQYWYAQNVVLYCDAEFLARHEKLRNLREQTKDNVLSIVHPRQLEASIWRFGFKFPRDAYLSQVLRALPALVVSAVTRRFSGREYPRRQRS